MVRTKRASHRVGTSEVDEMDASSRSPSPPAQQQPAPPPRARGVNEMGFVCIDDEQQRRYVCLLSRTCKCTRGVDWQFFEEVGLKEDFRMRLNNLGLKALSDLEEDTYRNWTLEFLSSLRQVRRGDDELPYGTLRFRLRGAELSLTPGEFGRLFRVHYEGLVEVTPGFDANSVWSSLIGQPERFVKEGNASRMQNPQDRMLHAFLACTLTFRGDSTHKVTKEDLFLLWCYKEGWQVNAAGWLMDRIHKTARKGKGSIMVGGYVSRIAKHFGIRPTEEDMEYRIPYVARQHGMGEKILMGSRVIEKPESRDPSSGAQFGVAGGGESSAGTGQAQTQGEQRPVAQSSRRRPRASTGQQSTSQETALTEMMASMMRGMTTGFSELHTRMDEGFQSLDARMSRVEARLDAYVPPAPLPRDESGPHPPVPGCDISDFGF